MPVFLRGNRRFRSLHPKSSFHTPVFAELHVTFFVQQDHALRDRKPASRLAILPRICCANFRVLAVLLHFARLSVTFACIRQSDDLFTTTPICDDKNTEQCLLCPHRALSASTRELHGGSFQTNACCKHMHGLYSLFQGKSSCFEPDFLPTFLFQIDIHSSTACSTLVTARTLRRACVRGALFFLVVAQPAIKVAFRTTTTLSPVHSPALTTPLQPHTHTHTHLHSHPGHRLGDVLHTRRVCEHQGFCNSFSDGWG